VVNVLLIDDDITFTKIVETFLVRKGYAVEARHSLGSGIEALQSRKFDLLLLDYRLPDGNGLELISRQGDDLERIPTIVITSFNDVKTAVKTIQSGVLEYITKPVNPDELIMVIETALQKESAENAVVAAGPVNFIQGTSASARKLYEHIALVAPTEMSVMILGESGTGKEHIARSIHDLSKKSKHPFVAIDCGVLSKELGSSELFGHVKGAFTGALTDKVGLIESADGGTVFLDEIGNLSYDVQIKLLRMLQERTIQPIGSNKVIKVDVRLITATNEDLNDSMAKGNFREDIYHRINEFKIRVPALRERGSDLELFVDHFVRLSNKELGKKVDHVSAETLEIFYQYDWPGNLRELKNVIKRMVLLTTDKVARPDVLPEEMVHALLHEPQKRNSDLKVAQENSEKELITQALEQSKYNKTKAARLLNIDRKTLYYKMERYGIS
jgi:two-component system response regulator HydG